MDKEEHTTEYYSAIKKNEILPLATTQMDREGIMPNELSQTKTNTSHCLVPFPPLNLRQKSWINHIPHFMPHDYHLCFLFMSHDYHYVFKSLFFTLLTPCIHIHHSFHLFSDKQFFFFFFFFCLFAFSRATATAHGGSQARGLIRAAATGLSHNHSNSGSEPSLRPTL